ncbi:MAG TPA: hypothetical protein VGO91_12010 [Pyrinomonadaceae bacterium]|jgi:hypothetical protein|nr:hypothetical protein [Pyrinomonadaceae bacterium]
MKSRTLSVIIICLLLSPLCARAQEGGGQLVVPLESAGFVAFKIETVPSGSPLSNGSTQAQELVNPRALKGEHHVIHRVLADADGDFVFGYDLTVEPLANVKQFKVAVGPLSPEFAEQLRAGNNVAGQAARRPNINVHTISRSTESQIIDDGDGFALDLLINQQTGVKIVDVVKVSFDRAKLWQSPAGEQYPIRDFTLANVELAVRDYKLLVNDEQVAGGKPTRGCEGALVWFYVPGKGRFIFSLIPHQGYDFRKVGVIEDNKISFTLGSDHYEWISSAPVVGNGGNWNVWVLVDSTYIPIPEFYPPAKDSAVASRGGIKQAVPPFLSQLLGGVFPSMRERNKAGHTVKQIPESAEKLEQIPSRVRVSIGAADRIENLWPKN